MTGREAAACRVCGTTTPEIVYSHDGAAHDAASVAAYDREQAIAGRETAGRWEHGEICRYASGDRDGYDLDVCRRCRDIHRGLGLLPELSPEPGREATPEWRRTEVRPLGHLHRPRFYRYRPADTRRRITLNRYPFSLIGAGVVLGGWCWCVKWADAAGYEPVTPPARKAT